MNTPQSHWQSNRFLIRLQTAARGDYVPRTRRPKGLRQPPGALVAQLTQPAIGLDDLCTDLLAEKRTLLDRHGRSDRALGYLHHGLKGDPRNVKVATVGRIGEALAEHSKKIARLNEEIATCKRRIDLIQTIRDTLIVSSQQGWQTFGRARIGDLGKIYAEGIDPTAEMPLPQDHPVIQMGKHLVLIFAGDDRADHTGIQGDLLPFAPLAHEKSRQPSSGDDPILGTVTDDILRRVAALARTISKTSIRQDLSLETTAIAQTGMTAAAAAYDLIKQIFWALVPEIHPESAGEDLRLNQDWTLSARPKPKRSKSNPLLRVLSEIFGGAGGTSDGGGLKEMLEEELRPRMNSFPPGFLDRLRAVTPNCGNPNCKIHGSRNGNGQRRTGRNRVPAGAGA